MSSYQQWRMGLAHGIDKPMSRRSPRVRARFAATVQIGGVSHSLICHTRDISLEGCFLETSERISTGVGVVFSILDNEVGDVVTVEGHVAREVDGQRQGIGVRLIEPSEAWRELVQRFHDAHQSQKQRPNLRLKILVVSSESNRRGATALYVTSGWDIRFAVNFETAKEALKGFELDAVICEYELMDAEWRNILLEAKLQQPNAKRLVRSRLSGLDVPLSGGGRLVHRYVNSEHGMDALLDALTAELGQLREALIDPQTGALLLGKLASHTLLRSIQQECADKEDSIAVFDLDSTLLDNAPRQSYILRQYGAEMSVPVLAQSKAEHWITWDVGEAMANCGLDAEGIEKHRDAFKDYWRERFFTSEYCKMDEMIPEASTFVQSILEHGGKVYYLTGRHEEMREGSIDCLKRLGFPVPTVGDDTVVLLMKPTLEEDDDAYKQETYSYLAKQGTVVAAFDNEPTHINGYRRSFPNAFAVHLATDHSGRDIKVMEGVQSIADFTLSEL